MSVRPGAILLSEVIGALSYALDITEGEPPGHAARSCMIGMRLAEELRLDPATRWTSSTRCCSRTPAAPQTPRTWRRCSEPTTTRPSTAQSASTGRGRSRRSCGRCKTVAPGRSPRARLDRLLAIKDEGEVTRSLMQARCDRGAEIALMIGLSHGTAEAIRTLDEHWDGRGQPSGSPATRSRCSAGSCAWRRPSRSSMPRAASMPPIQSQPGARAAGSTPAWWRRSRHFGTTPASGPRSPSPTSPTGSRRTRCSRSTTIGCCRSPAPSARSST